MTNYSYVSSGSIEVFPAGFRGEGYPQAQLTTEQNLISLKNWTGKNLIYQDVTDDSYCVLEIGGYRFRLLQSAIPENALYAVINLRHIGGELGNVLAPVLAEPDGSYVLDSGGESSEFIGLGFCSDSTDLPTEYCLQIRDTETGLLKLSNTRFSSNEISDASNPEKTIDQEFHTEKLITGSIESEGGTLSVENIDADTVTVSEKITAGNINDVDLRYDDTDKSIKVSDVKSAGNDITLKGISGLLSSTVSGSTITQSVVNSSNISGTDIINIKIENSDNGNAVQISNKAGAKGQKIKLPYISNDTFPSGISGKYALINSYDGSNISGELLRINSQPEPNTLVQRDQNTNISVSNIYIFNPTKYRGATKRQDVYKNQTKKYYILMQDTEGSEVKKILAPNYMVVSSVNMSSDQSRNQQGDNSYNVSMYVDATESSSSSDEKLSIPTVIIPSNYGYSSSDTENPQPIFDNQDAEMAKRSGYIYLRSESQGQKISASYADSNKSDDLNQKNTQQYGGYIVTRYSYENSKIQDVSQYPKICDVYSRLSGNKLYFFEHFAAKLANKSQKSRVSRASYLKFKNYVTDSTTSSADVVQERVFINADTLENYELAAQLPSDHSNYLVEDNPKHLERMGYYPDNPDSPAAESTRKNSQYYDQGGEVVLRANNVRISGGGNLYAKGMTAYFNNAVGKSFRTIQSASQYATLTSTGVETSSDKRLKENIKVYKPKSSIADLKVRTFNFIGDDKVEIGCLAQDLQKIEPALVTENENGYLSIKESKLVYLLLTEIQKLRQEVDELKSNQKQSTEE